MRKAATLLAKTASSTTTTIATTKIAAKSITVAEMKTAIPSSSSTEESMMPWEGWFSSFLKSKMGEKYQPFRDFWMFRPDDINNFEQMPKPNVKHPITEDGKTHMFRHVSPGSQPPVNIPDADVGTLRDDPFQVTYYPTDTRRRFNDPANPNPELERIKVEMMGGDENDPRVQAALKKLEEGTGSSPGNKGMFATGKSDYDPSGLRATMSASHEAMNAELDRNSPNHLPTPCWVDKQDEIIAWYEERNLPIPPGGVGASFIPTEGRIARW